MNLAVRRIINSAPDAAGVYIMKDAAGKIIYIGKAKSLKNRLLSYVDSDLASKTLVMIEQVCSIEFKRTQNEALALFLEASLIKQHQPKYNILLRDDKSFPLIKISNEPFPLISITRKKENDQAVYLGPFTSAALLKEALKIIRVQFPFRSCKNLPKKACMYYRIHLCPAPCIEKISQSKYKEIISRVRLILEGRSDELITRLSKEMQEKAKLHEFEEAALIRDKIEALSSLGERYEGIGWEKEAHVLQQLLKLSSLPERIEAFDISNISGTSACGSMVSFFHGAPDKNNYRRFKIKTIQGIDDYAMIQEIVKRRYARLLRENIPLPDVILIDGGKGHLLSAHRVLSDLKMNTRLMSIAKEDENIYVYGFNAPLHFLADNPALNLIRRVRDEAHRFAISYHRLLRSKHMLSQ